MSIANPLELNVSIVKVETGRVELGFVKIELIVKETVEPAEIAEEIVKLNKVRLVLEEAVQVVVVEEAEPIATAQVEPVILLVAAVIPVGTPSLTIPPISI